MTPWEAYLYWRPEFAKAIDETLYPIGWLDQRVLIGTAQVLHADDACGLYEFVTYPSGNVQVEGIVTAGNIETVRDVFMPILEQEARRVGAVGVEVTSRQGWGRLLRDSGYEVYQTTVRKTLA